MLLNYEEIKNLGLLSDDNPLNYNNATYNLVIGAIINAHGQTVDEYKIPPQGMVMVVSKEKFCLKPNIIGYTTVKNSLSVSGILSINIGIVDCQYNGPISSVLINFGKNEFEIKKGQAFMRMTFHDFTTVNNNIPLKHESTFMDEAHYARERKKDAMILGNKFLYLNKEIESFKLETKKSLVEYFAKLSVIISIIIGALSLAYSTYTSRSESETIQKYQSSRFVMDKLIKRDSILKQDSIKLDNKLNEIETLLKTIDASPKKKR